MTTAAKPRQKSRAARILVGVVAAVVVLGAFGMHAPGVLLLIGLAVVVVLAVWLRVRWARYSAGGRVAARKRRKYQGPATRKEIRAKLSPAAARRKAAVVSPDLHPAYAPVVIGEAKGRTIAGGWHDTYLLFAPPQSMKTALISCWAADAPGALLATSSRGDLYRHSAGARQGDVYVLNADGDGDGIPTNFAWSPVEGCEDSRTATRRAGALMAAAPRDSSGKDSWHEDRGARLIRYMLHAAAIAGASMYEVDDWVSNPLSPEPMKALGSSRAEPGWAFKLAGLIADSGENLPSLVASASAGLGWMDDSLLKGVACPLPGDGLNVREFVASGTGSIYLIGEDREHGSPAPYFAALTSELFHQARMTAEASGGRLPIPFTMALDELATIVPVPFHKWISVSAGYNIGLIGGIQSPSQLPERWGEHNARTIRNNTKIKIIGGGFTEPEDLEALSFICGETDTWHDVKSSDGSRSRQHDKQRLFPPERIKQLPDWHALVLHRNARPVEATITPVWARKGYEPVADTPVPAEPPAIEAPRTPIALPYSPALSAITDTRPATVHQEEQWHAATTG